MFKYIDTIVGTIIAAAVIVLAYFVITSSQDAMAQFQCLTSASDSAACIN